MSCVHQSGQSVARGFRGNLYRGVLGKSIWYLRVLGAICSEGFWGESVARGFGDNLYQGGSADRYLGQGHFTYTRCPKTSTRYLYNKPFSSWNKRATSTEACWLKLN